MNKESFQKEIAELKEEIEVARAKAVERVKEKFQEVSKSFFDGEERLESFGWTQYTDYFNDGDECNFSARIDRECLLINGTYMYSSDVEKDGLCLANKAIRTFGWGKTERDNPQYEEKVEKMVEDIAEFLSGIGDDLLESAFGDHCKVTVYRDKIELEQYTEHD